MDKQYDDKGRLTRAAALQIIASGGSVAMGGNIYTRADTLPSEADFAKGDEKAEREAKARLEKTIADAQAQLTSLNAPATTSATETTTTARKTK